MQSTEGEARGGRERLTKTRGPHIHMQDSTKCLAGRCG